MLERPVLPLVRPGAIWRDFGGIYAVNAVVAFIFAASGPVAIILAVGTRGGLSEADLSSWIFGSSDQWAPGAITVLYSLGKSSGVVISVGSILFITQRRRITGS